MYGIFKKNIRSPCFVGCNPTRYLILPKKHIKYERDWIQRLYLHRNPQNLFRKYKSWAFTNFHNKSDCLLQNKQTNDYKDKVRETCLKLVKRFVKIRIRNGCISRYVKCQFGCGILKMVGPKKQDFWPKINILKENHCIL